MAPGSVAYVGHVIAYPAAWLVLSVRLKRGRWLRRHARSALDWPVASQRTFHGAYSRTALSELAFALVVMRIFEPEFFWVGLAVSVMAVGLFITAAVRFRMTLQYEKKVNEMSTISGPRHTLDAPRDTPARNTATPTAETDAYLLLPRFRTAGYVVALASVFVVLVEVAIIVLLLVL
ncbi:hypothetical protein MSPP1_001006 [Malassezia sp. CBS 17886]|nr:hypothetical protein MSPP1_001006 [Malassezia sp. CBS 17886]